MTCLTDIAARPGVGIELGEDDAVDIEFSLEAAGRVQSVLAAHGVDNEEDVMWLQEPLDLRQLAHQFVVDMEAAGGVEHQDVDAFLPCRGECSGRHRRQRRRQCCDSAILSGSRSKKVDLEPPGTRKPAGQRSAAVPNCRRAALDQSAACGAWFFLRTAASFPQVVVLPEPRRPHMDDRRAGADLHDRLVGGGLRSAAWDRPAQACLENYARAGVIILAGLRFGDVATGAVN